MKIKTIKRYATLGCVVSVFFAVLLIAGCKKTTPNESGGSEGGGEESTPKEVTYHGSLFANVKVADTTRNIDGNFRIEGTAFNLESLMGTITGKATKNGEIFDIVADEGSGIFKGIAVSGTVSLSAYDTHDMLLTGNNAYGSAVEVEGVGEKVFVLEDANQAWRDQRSKSAVYFTHNSTCRATITIDGRTLSGLESHYEENGLCNDLYRTWRDHHEDVDQVEVSETVFCNSFSLINLAGDYEEFQSCPTAAFIVDKNTEYNYTVEWDNGETASGTFKSADGGKRMAICLVNKGRDCEYTNEPGGDQIRIVENTLAIDAANSRYGEDETAFDFTNTAFYIRRDRTIDIGRRAELNSMIAIEMPAGVKDGTYALDDFSRIRLAVTVSGDRRYERTNDFDLWKDKHKADTKGRVTIVGADSPEGLLTLTFHQAIVQNSYFISTGREETFIRFSGKVSGYVERVD